MLEKQKMSHSYFFPERTNGFRWCYTTIQNAPYIFIDKNMMINAKTYQDKVLAKIMAP